jgi:raffinose/stachyose/melibiose transport system permease protein
VNERMAGMGTATTGAHVGRLLRRDLAHMPLYVALLMVTVIYVFPLLYLLNVALKAPQAYLFDPTGMTKSLDFTNFSDAWVRGNFAHYFGNTILYTVAATAIGVTSSLLVALPISRGYVKWSSVWYTLFVVSLFLPSALIPQFQLILHLHLYNTQIGYILLSSGLGIGPFMIIGYLRSIPRELDEAASIDGCGYLRFNLLMLPPLIKPILVTAALLQAIGVWNDIIGPTIYLSSPGYYPVSLGLFTFYGQYGNDWTVLAAAVLIVAAPLIVLFVLLQRYFMEGATAGAIK